MTKLRLLLILLSIPLFVAAAPGQLRKEKTWMDVFIEAKLSVRESLVKEGKPANSPAAGKTSPRQMAEDLLKAQGLPFEIMLPLIDETARKVHSLSPLMAQTGPAARGDVEVMKQQVALLEDFPEMQELYKTMSRCIYRLKQEKNIK